MQLLKSKDPSRNILDARSAIHHRLAQFYQQQLCTRVVGTTMQANAIALASTIIHYRDFSFPLTFMGSSSEPKGSLRLN
jgi:hypothetical protein